MSHCSDSRHVTAPYKLSYYYYYYYYLVNVHIIFRRGRTSYKKQPVRL